MTPTQVVVAFCELNTLANVVQFSDTQSNLNKAGLDYLEKIYAYVLTEEQDYY